MRWFLINLKIKPLIQNQVMYGILRNSIGTQLPPAVQKSKQRYKRANKVSEFLYMF
jgi:hypothetical protein